MGLHGHLCVQLSSDQNLFQMLLGVMIDATRHYVMSPLLLTSLHVYFYKACLERKKTEKWFPFLILYAFQLPCYQAGKYVGTLSIFTGTVCSLILNSKPKKDSKNQNLIKALYFFTGKKDFHECVSVVSFCNVIQCQVKLLSPICCYIFYLLEQILNFRPP